LYLLSKTKLDIPLRVYESKNIQGENIFTISTRQD
jgi:hypothetical protein